MLLSNGWDREMRHRAAENFGFEFDEVDERHHLTSDTYGEDALTLDQYLERAVFFKKRDFSPQRAAN